MVTVWRLWFFNRISRFEYVFQENSVFFSSWFDLNWRQFYFIYAVFIFCITKGQEIVLAQHFPLVMQEVILLRRTSGACFSKAPVTLRARNEIFKSKFKE